MKIKLKFISRIDLELLDKGIPLLTVRIIAQVKLKTHDGWSISRDAILDTGLPISVLPKDMWHNIIAVKLAPYQTSGIVSKEECSLKGWLGEVSSIIHDDESESESISLKAFLAPISNIPVIIGFHDYLTQFDLFCSYRRKDVWLVM